MIILSIILPVYKPDLNYFGACINALKKGLTPDIELIIVNDCPGDESFLGTLSGVDYKLINNSINIGQGLSRQRGMEIATGKYITFVDQDDEFYGFDLFINDPKIPLLLYTPQVVVDALGNKRVIYDLNTLHGMFFNRNAILSNGIHFSDKYRSNEDLYFMAQVGMLSEHTDLPMIPLDFVTYTWYLWDGSTSHKDGEGVYYKNTYPEFLQVQYDIIKIAYEKYGLDEYLTNRLKSLIMDTFFATQRFPELTESSGKFIKRLKKLLHYKKKQLIELLNDKEYYMESYFSAIERLGTFTSNNTFNAFLEEYL